MASHARVFLSLRFGEAMRPAQLLKDELEQHGISAFLCDIPEGMDIAGAISENLERCACLCVSAACSKLPTSLRSQRKITTLTLSTLPFYENEHDLNGKFGTVNTPLPSVLLYVVYIYVCARALVGTSNRMSFS